jgi:hypothetical protein
MFNCVVNYKICEICFKQIIKTNQLNCKKCNFESDNKKSLNGTMHKIKLNKNSKTLTKVLNVTQNYIGKN